MFENLTDRLGSVFDNLRGKGALGPKDVDEALREVRRALLEADVALPVAKAFVDKVRERAVGQEVLRSVTPGQQVVKIVHDAMVETLGATAEPISLAAAAPVVIMMVGLQGTGKTTTTFTTQNGSQPVQDDFCALLPDGRVLASENGCFAKTYGLNATDEPAINIQHGK